MNDVVSQSLETLQNGSRFLRESATFILLGLATVLSANANLRSALEARMSQDSSLTLMILMLLAAILIVSALMSLMCKPILRSLEGYGWDVFPLSVLRNWRIRSWTRRHADARKLLQTELLKKKERSAAEISQLAALQDEVLHSTSTGRALPSHMGNILRAAEDYPSQRYGINGVRTWGLLWLVMPAHARTEISQARLGLNKSVVSLTFGIAFGMWACALPFPSIWTGVPFAMSVVWAVVAYYAMIDRAKNYATLVRAAYDAFRFDIYKILRLPPPDAPFTELFSAAHGKPSVIDEFLFSVPSDNITYTSPSNDTR
jgi:hypothetical protein